MNPVPDQSWTVSQIAEQSPPEGWGDLFIRNKANFAHIDRMLTGQSWLPLRYNLFRAFELTPLASVKVVILGQDPYPGMYKSGEKFLPVAVGMAFSTSRNNPDIPASLANIFREIRQEYPDIPRHTHGDLSYWARQGVLLLNAGLTFSPSSKSHAGFWQGFVKEVLTSLKRKGKLIYLLWGNEAKVWEADCSKAGVVLTCAHPSPLSATRGFFGCNHFKLVNDFLTSRGQTPIDWSLKE